MSRRFAVTPDQTWHSCELRIVDSRKNEARYEVIEIGPTGDPTMIWRTGILEGARKQIANRTEALLSMGYHWINKPYRITYNDDGTASIAMPAAE